MGKISSKFLRPLKLVLITSCLLLFSSCSLLNVGYSYADWLIKRRIMEVIKLYSPQQERLEKILDDYMLWHRSEMLPRYQAQVEYTVKKIEVSQRENKKISAKEVHQFLLAIRDLYLDSFIPLAHRVSPVLSELGEEQVDRSKTLINRKMEVLKGQAELSAKEYRQDMKETWLDNLEDWFSELTAQQKDMLQEHLDLIITSPKARFARAGKRGQQFFSIYEDNPLPVKEDKVKTAAVLKKREALLIEFFNNWSEKKPFDKWRLDVANFMEKFLASLTPEQQKHFLDKAKDWQDSLAKINKQ